MTAVLTDAIHQAVQRYFDGHATGSPSVMRLAFHESARVQFVQGGRYAVWSLDEYVAKLPGRPADDEGRRRRRIVALTASGDAAAAELELDYPAVRFVDYLSLLRVDGEWLIVNKSFQAHPKSPASP
jgi:hypothetical protein